MPHGLGALYVYPGENALISSYVMQEIKECNGKLLIGINMNVELLLLLLLWLFGHVYTQFMFIITVPLLLCRRGYWGPSLWPRPTPILHVGLVPPRRSTATQPLDNNSLVLNNNNFPSYSVPSLLPCDYIRSFWSNCLLLFPTIMTIDKIFPIDYPPTWQ